MKTLVLTTALVVLTTLTYAQSEKQKTDETKTAQPENVICNLYPSGHDQVTLILRKQAGDKVTVKLKEDNGSLVYMKNIRKANDSKITYDVAKLPDGSYTFEVVKDKEVVYSQAIRKGATTIAMSK